MNKEKLRQTANWSSVVKRPTWGTVTSRELSQILGVTLQTINNWHIRGRLPEPEPRKRGQGNKNRFQISKIRSWLESRPEDDLHWEWINEHMGEGFVSLEQARKYAFKHYKAFEIQFFK